jgi:hypothetical protein
MISVMHLYEEVCRKQLIPASRQKDIRTAINYLAASTDTTPEALPLDRTLEATYRNQLRAYFSVHPKGRSTIRNTIQAIGQLLKAAHQLDQSPPVPLAPPIVPKPKAAERHLFQHSPYQHQTWLKQHPYSLAIEQWPADIATAWQKYRRHARSRTRATSVEIRYRHLMAYLGYQMLAPDNRLPLIHLQAHKKLHTKPFEHDRFLITSPAALTSWAEVFNLDRIQSFLTWHAWRIHTPEDAEIPGKAPSRPSTFGQAVTGTVGLLAKHFKRRETKAIYALKKSLPKPKRIHDKRAPYHRFEFSELEHVALGLMAEARQMQPAQGKRYPGARRTVRFHFGLILAMGWRNPMRARNWCEAILDINLKHEGTRWYWRFEGDELKIGVHRGETNIFEPEVDPDVIPWLEEYLEYFRPQLPNAAHDRHVFLSQYGHPLTPPILLTRLRVHVYRYTGKRFYTHLLRSIFMSHHMTAGVDLNSIAYAMNDMPLTTLNNYNELMADKHRPIIADANRAALANGHKPLTPPTIPLPPKRSKPTDPDQLALI